MANEGKSKNVRDSVTSSMEGYPVKKRMKQTLITDYYDEFTHLHNRFNNTHKISTFAMFTPYKSSEEFTMTFFRKNWKK